jgi:hypothetical protein
MIDLHPIKTRLAAATPGPWRRDTAKWAVKGDVVYTTADGGADSLFTIRCDDAPCVEREEDAEFIAHARTDMKELVAEVERLRSRLSVANAKPLKFEPMPGEFEDDDGA